jgi:hypothetical protein
LACELTRLESTHAITDNGNRFEAIDDEVAERILILWANAADVSFGACVDTHSH